MKVTDLRRRLLAALAAGGVLAPSAVYAADLNTNLVVNPAFESVNTAIHPPPSDPPLPLDNSPLILNWSGVQGFAYSHNLTGGVPDYANGGPLATGGNYYFTSNATPGDIDAPGEFFQDINVAGGASGTLIATGNAAFKLSGFFSGYLTNGDFGTAHVSFLNGVGTSLGTASVSDSNTMVWGEDFRGGLIPVGTQTVRLSLFGTALSGGPDGYIDNVSFQVTNEVIQPALSLTINRDTGAMTLANQTGSAVPIKSYSITSAFEALDPVNWRSIADNYDAGSPGPNQVDAAHNWSELTDPAANGDLSEADLESGMGATLAHSRTVNLGNANTWIKNPTEDLVFQYISGTQLVQGLVQFTGHGNLPFVDGDLNVDSAINSADWVILRTNQHTNLSNKSLAEAYRLGDLNADRLSNHADFVEFKALYDAANGAGSFVAMLASIPEPTTSMLVLTVGLLMPPIRRRSANH